MTYVSIGDCLSSVTLDKPPVDTIGGVHDEVFDTNKRFVRITGVRNNSLVEFDFSIGEPEIYIELVLPFQAFQEFSVRNNVAHLTPAQAAAVDYDRLKWRYGQPGVDH